MKYKIAFACYISLSFLIGCSNYSEQESESIGSGIEVTIDNEHGVACYVRRLSSSGLSCVKLTMPESADIPN